MAKAGAAFIDAYGVIATQKFNTLEHLGEEYNWSVSTPGLTNELMTAENAKDDVRNILTRLISAEIRYTTKGYQIGPPNFGFVNAKEDTSDGKRTIQKLHPVESKWIFKMFEMKAAHTYSDDEIIQSVNNMGFKTRIIKLRDKFDKTKVIGIKGDAPLNVRYLYVLLQNPIYAGVQVKRWNDPRNKGKKRRDWKARMAQYNGLVDIELWNEANQGRYHIIKSGDDVRVIQGDEIEDKPRLLDFSFPYKWIHCPKCFQPLNASSTTKSNGRKFPAYHCHTQHRQVKYGKHYFRVNLKDFEKTMEDFIRSIKFKDNVIMYWKKYLIEEWNKELLTNKRDSKTAQEVVSELEGQEIMLHEQLSWATTPEGFRTIEGKLTKIANDKAKAVEGREKQELKAIEWQKIVNLAGYFFEHLEDLLLGQTNPVKRSALFRVIFTETPTYDDLRFRTARLEGCMELISNADTPQKLVGEPLSTLNRLREFCELFLRDGLNSEFAYTFGLKYA